jgi:sporulation protein YlmC with PRC-barrel domain
MLLLDIAPYPDGQTTPRPSPHRVSRRSLSGVMLSIAVLFASAAPQTLAQAAVALIEVDVKEVAQGFQTSELVGTAIQNDKGEKIGTLDDLVITKDRSLFAILQVGGFLGLGGYLVAIPYESLNISDDGRKITLAGASKEALQKLPEFKFKK